MIALAVVALAASAAAGDRQAEYIQLRLLIGEQRFSEALERCQALIVTYPDYVYLYETLAEVGLYAQDLGVAARFFEERIEDGTGLEYSYFGLGTVYFNMAAYREAALCFDRAIELGIAAPECYRNFVYAYERLEGVDASVRFFNSQCHRDPKNPHLWYAVALAYWSKRDYPTVLKNLEEALSRNPTEQKYLQAKAAILVLLNRGSEGAEAISDLLSNTMKADDLNDSQFLRSYLVLAHELGGDSSVAKAGTWENLVQARKFGMYRWIGWGYERMADYEFLSCNFEIALSFSTKAIEASRKCADQNLLVAGLVRQYESYMELGDYKQALGSVHTRLSHFKNSNANADSIRAFIDIAWAYHEMGDDKVAMDYAIEAVNKVEAARPNPAMSLRVQSTLGLIYEGLGNYSAAVNSFQASLKYISHDKVGVQNLAIVHGNIGRALMALGKMESSIKHFNDELRMTRHAGFQKEEAYAHNHLGLFYLKCGNITRAQEEFACALQLGRQLGQKQVMMESTRGLAQASESGGDFVQALAYYQTAIDICEGMTIRGRHPWAESRLARDKQKDYRECVRMLCRLERVDEAFQMCETAKLEEAAYYGPALHGYLMERMPEESKLRLLATRGDIQRRREKLAEERMSAISKVSSPNFQLADEIARLENSYLTDLEDFLLKNPLLLDQNQVRAQTASEIRTSLVSEEEAIIEVNLTDSETNVFLLTRDTLLCYTGEVSRQQIRNLMARISSVFDSAYRPGDVFSATMANFDPTASYELYSLLLAWTEPFLSKKSSLVVVADDVLRRFSFECLVTRLPTVVREQDFRKAQFLLEQFSVRYANAACQANRRRESSHVPGKFLLAIGNPYVNVLPRDNGISKSDLSYWRARDRAMLQLPGVQKEVRAIHSLLGYNADVLTGDKASKVAFLSKAKDYRAIHIASHFSIDSQDPLFSCIYLADDPESGDNGILYSFELLNAKINAELVVLSSCNSGRIAGEGVGEGLLAGFMAAGVPSVVATLWSVDDQSSAYLMEKFYSYLSQGIPKSRSLKLAKMDLVRSGKPDPFYWAGFVLFGNGSEVDVPLNGTKQWSSWWFAASLAGLVVLWALPFWIWHGIRRKTVMASADGIYERHSMNWHLGQFKSERRQRE